MYCIPSFPQYYQIISNGKKPHPKSKFTPAEDEKLKQIVNEVGDNSWDLVSKRMGTRNQRQCKERWFNYLSPNISFLPWSIEEDQKLIRLHEEFGAKWVKIAQYFPSRTDTNIKNRWMVLQRQKNRKLKKNEIMKEKQEIENHQTIENSISSPETELSENNSEVNVIANSDVSIKEQKYGCFNLFDEHFDLALTEVVNDQFCLDYF